MKNKREKKLQKKFAKIIDLADKQEINQCTIDIKGNFSHLRGLGHAQLTLPTCIYVSNLGDSQSISGHILNQPLDLINKSIDPNIHLGIDLSEKSCIELIAFINKKIHSSKHKESPSSLLYFEIEFYSFLFITINGMDNFKPITMLHNTNSLEVLHYQRGLLLKLVPIEVEEKLKSYFYPEDEQEVEH